MDNLDPLLLEDLQELNLIESRPATLPQISQLKAQEELEKHTVDEKLGDIERAVHLLCTGQEIQRLSVINNLPDLLREHNADCMRRVVPKVKEVLHVPQPEMQIAASTAFLHILQKELVPVQNYTQTFLQTILESVDSKDPDVATAWLDTLLDVVELLPKDVIKKDVLSMAVAKGQLAETVQSRLACCRVLGKIAPKFDTFTIKKEILPIVQSLCQDVEFEVRGCMCRQLDSVAQGLGLEATKSAILPELVELANDEESFVRLAGIETVVNILSLLDDDTCSSTIIPLVCKFCQQALQNEDSTLPIVSKQLGRLCHGLSVNLTDDQKQWFLEYYRKLCRIGLSEKGKTADKQETPNSPTKIPVIPDYPDGEQRHVQCRTNAAYNFPAMLLMIGARHFKSELYSTFSGLCKDPHVLVRKTVACGFHEVVKLLGNSVHTVQSDLISLLKEDSLEILKGLIPNLPVILDYMVKGGGNTVTESKMVSMADVIPAMLAAEQVIAGTNDWRLHALFIENLQHLPKVFTSDQIYFKFFPLVFKKIQTARPLPVRLNACRTILVLIRNNRKLEQREETICRLIEELCHGKSCHQRSLFIDICKLAMDLFSRNFFKEHLFEFLLELTTDPVPNIRLKLCSVLPKLKAQIKLPADRNLLQQLESCVRKLLINERDRDVTVAVRQYYENISSYRVFYPPPLQYGAVEDLDKTNVQMESLTRRVYLDEDVLDQKKEEEERLQIEMEERNFKEESADGKPPKDKKKDKKDSTTKIPGPKRGSKIPAATSTRQAGSKTSIDKDMKSSSNTSTTSVGSGKGTASPAASKASSNRSLKTMRNSSTGSPKLSTRNAPGSASSQSSSGSSRKSSASSYTSSSGPSPSPVGSAGRRRISAGSPGSPSPVAESPPGYRTANGQRKSLSNLAIGPAASKRKSSLPK